MSERTKVLLAWLFAPLVLYSTACVAPMLVEATATGDIVATFDGDLLVVDGEGQGTFSAKLGAIPISVPYNVEDGFTLYARLSTGQFLLIPDGTELPDWAR